MGGGVGSTPSPMPAPATQAQSDGEAVPFSAPGPEQSRTPPGRLHNTMLILVAVLVFVVVPIVELWVIVEVAGSLGIVPTLALLLAISVAGSLLVRAQGLGVLRRARAMWAEGRVPTDDLLDGVLVLGAGALLLTPGFVTDAIGLLLLVPLVRRLTGSLTFGRIRQILRLPVAGAEFVAGARPGGRAGAGVRADGSASGSGRRTVYVGEAVVVRSERHLPSPDEGV